MSDAEPVTTTDQPDEQPSHGQEKPDSSQNVGSPTPNNADYQGEMSREEYMEHPESNTGATVDTDVDPPGKRPPRKDDPNVPDEDVDKQAEQQPQATMQSTADQVHPEVAHGEQVTEKETKKREDWQQP